MVPSALTLSRPKSLRFGHAKIGSNLSHRLCAVNRAASHPARHMRDDPELRRLKEIERLARSACLLANRSY